MMAGVTPWKGKKKPRHGGRHRGHEKEHRPATHPVRSEQPAENDKARKNPNQTYDDMHDGEGVHAGIITLRFLPINAMTFLKYFFSIVGGALAASVLGGVFACVVALISPEFVATLFLEAAAAGGSLVRYAAAVGMIWGLFLGTAVMAFSILLVTIIHAVRIIRKKSDAQSD